MKIRQNRWPIHKDRGHELRLYLGFRSVGVTANLPVNFSGVKKKSKLHFGHSSLCYFPGWAFAHTDSLFHLLCPSSSCFSFLLLPAASFPPKQPSHLPALPLALPTLGALPLPELDESPGIPLYLTIAPIALNYLVFCTESIWYVSEAPCRQEHLGLLSFVNHGDGCAVNPQEGRLELNRIRNREAISVNHATGSWDHMPKK